MVNMNLATQRVQGELWQAGETAVLHLLNDTPDKETTGDILFLRYPLIQRGTEALLFPAFLLDDWGNEVRSLKLYEWIREFGEQFPRAEIFGVSQFGQETQLFLRDVELYAKLPCYVYTNRKADMETGVLLSGVLLPAEGTTDVVRVKRPGEIKRPLRSARLSWWQLPPQTTSFNFNLLNAPAEEGF
ncbi:MAG: hypothetical protein R3C62_05775 [Chloroflexota bacterium]